MSKSEIVEPVATEEPDQAPTATKARTSAASGLSIRRWLDLYRQLEWPDRLNMILAALLGAILIAILSPILLVLWLWQLARRSLALEESSRGKARRS